MAGRALIAAAVLSWAATLYGSTPALTPAPASPGAMAQVPVHTPELFQTSNTCIVCHNDLVTPAGQDVSIGADWQASMMANSARDPYWQAAVRREVIDHPEEQAVIEDECSICHMPMTTAAARLSGQMGRIFDRLPIGRSEAPDAALAADGVSCAICHQIGPERLGTSESFTGGYVIDTTRPTGMRQMYGPFEVDAGRTRVMQSASGFVPTESAHLQSSELCATCHTLFTSPVGAPAGASHLPEQTPYLEWQQSGYAGTQSCQSCHMPVVESAMPLSRVLGQPREGLSRHVFRGGNFFMMRVLNRYRDELGVVATPEQMDRAIERTIDHLQTGTARVTIEEAAITNGRLEVGVMVTNLAGHKLPTAYPSRRAWIQLTARNASGQIVFESGAFQPNGRITGNDNDVDGSRFEPHYAEIAADDQVQIYESVLVDGAGAVTTGLLTGATYVKDNRLLPAGLERSGASGDIAVHGNAATDDSFAAGGDRVRYSVPVNASGPLDITVQLWFQPIGYRWAENLRAYDADETRRFVRYFDEMAGASAVVIARAEQRTQ